MLPKDGVAAPCEIREHGPSESKAHGVASASVKSPTPSSTGPRPSQDRSASGMGSETRRVAANPMKKRFRSWEAPNQEKAPQSNSANPNERQEEPPRRRRRYPQLVIRDKEGHYTANPIGNAPKVALPLEPVYPRHIETPQSTSPSTKSLGHPAELLRVEPHATPKPSRTPKPNPKTSPTKTSKPLQSPIPIHPRVQSTSPPPTNLPRQAAGAGNIPARRGPLANKQLHTRQAEPRSTVPHPCGPAITAGRQAVSQAPMQHQRAAPKPQIQHQNQAVRHIKAAPHRARPVLPTPSAPHHGQRRPPPGSSVVPKVSEKLPRPIGQLGQPGIVQQSTARGSSSIVRKRAGSQQPEAPPRQSALRQAVGPPEAMHPPQVSIRPQPNSLRQPRVALNLKQSNLPKITGAGQAGARPVSLHPQVSTSAGFEKAPHLVSNGDNAPGARAVYGNVERLGPSPPRVDSVTRQRRRPPTQQAQHPGASVSTPITHVGTMKQVGHPQSAPPRSDANPSPQQSRAPPLAPRPAGRPVMSEEMVIQAGKRCGTFEYWRSSLQMPRSRGAVKTIRNAATPQPRKRTKSPAAEKQTSPPPPTHARTPSDRRGGGQQKRHDTPSIPASHNVQRGTEQAEGSRPEVRKSVECEAVRAYWRSSTKLPSMETDKERMKRLADGRRLVSESQGEDGGDSDLDDGTKGRPSSHVPQTPHYGVLGAPVEPVRHGGRLPHTLAPNGHDGFQGLPPAQLYSDMSGQPGGFGQTHQALSYYPMTGPVFLPGSVNQLASENDMRKIHMTREFELKRLRALAHSKYNVKMNLRGRTKLENWLGSDRVTMVATNFIVTLFNLDPRVLSRDAADRRVALLYMNNGDLRILEALMLRVTNRGGNANWALLTSSFNADTFGDNLPQEQEA